MKYICDQCNEICQQVYLSIDKKSWLCSKCNESELKKDIKINPDFYH